MKNNNSLLNIEILLYVFMLVTDRFIVSIPDIIYIPITLIGAVLIIIDLIRKRKTR